jgi:hypothetical protein
MNNHFRHPQDPIATPAVGATAATIWDDGKLTRDTAAPGKSAQWVIVACLLSQGATLIHWWAPRTDSPDSDLVNISSADTSFAITGGAFFQKAVKLRPGRNRLTVLAGATPPTATWIASEISYWPGGW